MSKLVMAPCGVAGKQMDPMIKRRREPKCDIETRLEKKCDLCG